MPTAEVAPDVQVENSPLHPTPTTTAAAIRRKEASVVSQPPHLRRDASSSIASNLATARGIPPGRRHPSSQSPAQVSIQAAEGRVVNPSRRSKIGEFESKSLHGNGSEISPARHDSTGPADASRTAYSALSAKQGPPPPIATANSDEPFSKFYSAFNNVINTISAPLAFAGLPLNPTGTITPITKSLATATTTNSPPQALRVLPTSPTAHPTVDQDLTRLFSRAALRAVREENGFGPVAESFYVVPTTGGTMSYAGMLSHARQGSNVGDDEPEAEFVDARETPAGNSPIQSRYARQRRPGSAYDTDSPARRPLPGSNKTWEELHVENETLKNVVVDLGDRLRAFELGAQKSSLALHASMRQFSSPSASSVTPGGKVPPLPGSAAEPISSTGLGAGTKQLEDRIRQLDGELKAVKKDNRKLGRENQKYLGVIEKYRERWEALKEGARERVKGGSIAEQSPEKGETLDRDEDEE